MKKSMIIAAALMISGGIASTNVSASSVQPNNNALVEQTDQNKKMVKPEELPAQVQKTLSSKKYEGWKISKAYWNKKSNMYEVKLKNAQGEKNVVMLNKKGTPAKAKDQSTQRKNMKK